MEIGKKELELITVIDYMLDVFKHTGHEKEIREFFESIPNVQVRASCNRDFSRMLAYAHNTMQDILKHMSENDQKEVIKWLDNSELIMRPRSAALSQENTVVSYEDLQRLINSSMEGNCAICMKSDLEIKNCPLRRTLNHVALPDTKYHFGQPCPHINKVITKKRGEYIDDV